MFVSVQKTMGLAMGILLGALGTSATLLAAGTSGQPVAQQSSIGQPMHIHDLPGTGATVAVIDTGVSEQKALGETPDGFLRLLAACGADDQKSYTPPVARNVSANEKGASKEESGGPSLVVARAVSVNGASSYLDAIRAIEWVISNKDQYHIRALDLAFSPPPSSTRGDDPLNRAVMAAWKAEIVVVSSAEAAGI